MRPVLTLAGLTFKEAVRRRLFVGGLLIALLFVLAGFIPFPNPRGLAAHDLADMQEMRGKVFAWLGCGMIKFFASILAVTLAAGSITAEVDRGVLSTVVPKPLSRWQIYLGKWLGFLGLLAIGMIVWGGLLALVIWAQTHTFHPRLFLGVLATGLFPLLFTTLTLFFSSFATYGLSAGLALIAAGVALAEDTLLLLSRFLNAPVLKTLSIVAGDIVPLSRMNHWITRGLGDAGMDLSAFAGRAANPSAVVTTSGDLAYVLIYITVFLALGLFIFQRRDL